MKSLSKLSFFTLGLLLGALGFWSLQQLQFQQVTKVDVALGETLYEMLQNYPPNWSAKNVSQVIEDLSNNKRVPQPLKDRDQLLMELAAIESEKFAQKNLEKADQFFTQLSVESGLELVVKNKVYVEILEQGIGDPISLNDVPSITFKQLDSEGNVLKNTEDKDFPVHLSRMIKGFKLGMEGAKIGEKRKIFIHPDYGFGKIGRGNEPNQILIYEVHIVKCL